VRYIAPFDSAPALKRGFFCSPGRARHLKWEAHSVWRSYSMLNVSRQIGIHLFYISSSFPSLSSVQSVLLFSEFFLASFVFLIRSNPLHPCHPCAISSIFCIPYFFNSTLSPDSSGLNVGRSTPFSFPLSPSTRPPVPSFTRFPVYLFPRPPVHPFPRFPVHSFTSSLFPLTPLTNGITMPCPIGIIM
jgi:hypothetical protein